jgi:hydrogenase maturation protease
MQVKKKSKTAIMGFGNPCRSDDGIGIYVVDKLKNTWPIDDENVSILDMGTGAFEVLFKLKGHNKIILVDAVINTNEPVGTIYKVPASEINAALQDHPMIFLHSIKWDQALSYAKKILQDEYPDDISVYLIAIDNTKLEMQINEVVKNSGDKVINLIKQELMQLHND